MRRGERVLAIALVLQASGAAAQPVADFYKGKSIDLIIASTVGGGYDAHSRVLAPFLTKHLPGNPRLVPKNMTGAGGLQAANYMFHIAAKDGTVIAAIQNTIPFEPMFDSKAAQFDALKFGYLGSANSEVSVLFVWHSSPIASMRDLLDREITASSTGGASTADFYGKALNALTGTKLKLISGYPGAAEAFLAVENGEVEAYPSAFWSTLKTTRRDWIAKQQIRLVVQMALEKHRELPDVPLVMDYAKDEDSRRALELVFAPLLPGRPYITAPGVPPERLKALQDAFMAAMEDKDYRAEAEKHGMEITPRSGTEVYSVIKRGYDTPKPIIDRVTALRQGQDK
jgi:tripartite-type tricarboxylate transporter receptor subunit TctC